MFIRFTTRRQLWSYPLLLLGIFSLACQSDTASPGVQEDLVFQPLFSHPSDESCYRIPALLTAANGNLLALCDERVQGCGDLRHNRDINLVCRLSVDDGKTWSAIERIIDYPEGSSASDPSLILDRQTGDIFLFFNFMDLDLEPDTYYFKVSKSADHGLTWSDPVDMTPSISKPEWQKDFKFITSGKGIQTRAGTLLHTLVHLEKGVFVFGSEDHGNTWFLYDQALHPGDESKIIELADGTWLVNSRVNKLGARYVHRSTDQGQTWNGRIDSTLIDPACNASLTTYAKAKDDKEVVLFSNPSDTNSRKNLQLRYSIDGGQHWSTGMTIYDGPAAYSSMSNIGEGDLGILFEKDEYKEITFVHLREHILAQQLFHH